MKRLRRRFGRTPDWIVGSRGKTVFAANGATAERLWSFAMPNEVWTTPALTQIDGDVVPDVIVGCDNGKLYALSGRATAFLGPALITLATALSGSQRLGIAPVILLFLLSLWLLYFVKTDNEQSGTPA